MDLLKLKSAVNAMSDEQLEMSMSDAWMGDEIVSSNVDEDRLLRLKSKIHREIKKEPHPNRLAFRWMQIAAAVLIPLLLFTGLYFYGDMKQLGSKRMVVSTGVGERATVTLPDGSTVQLNAKSQLSYSPVAFNKKKRQIHFNGEGYFDVAHNEDRPFIIDAFGLSVKVLGTKFNLLARDDDATAELALERGSVSFTSVLTGDRVIVKPEQKVVLDRSKGSITLYDLKHSQDVAAWKRHEMVFRNIPLSDVIAAIEKVYQVEFIPDSKVYLTETFTGTLTTSDINDDLQILEKSFHFKIMMKNNKVFISSNR